MAAFPATIQVGDTIIFDVGERQALVTLDAKSDVKLGKSYYPTAPIIGCPYGSMFALSADGKSLERIEHTPLTDWDPAPVDSALDTRNNAELVDAGCDAQALCTADIEAMKAEGTAGADIVAALTANSVTFAAKTEFSQAKYKKKKAKKYIQVATVRRPTAFAVCEAYFTSTPVKTGYMRADTLALLLNLANVAAHARVLVVEACGGLVTAAVAERLGGHGGVVSAWAGGVGTRPPPLGMWRNINLSSAQRAVIRLAPLHQLLTEQAQQAQQADEHGSSMPLPEAERPQGAGEAGTTGSGAAEPMDLQQAVGAPAGQQAQQPPPQQQQQPEQVQQDEQQQQDAQRQVQAQTLPAGTGNGALHAAGVALASGARQAQRGGPHHLLQPPFNSCILAAATLSPLALVRHVLPLLTPSATFAVHCPWQHPLAEAMDALKGQGQVANLALNESWYREMQVLPMRTHPSMNMNHGGGFILSGTVLAPQQGQQQQ